MGNPSAIGGGSRPSWSYGGCYRTTQDQGMGVMQEVGWDRATGVERGRREGIKRCQRAQNLGLAAPPGPALFPTRTRHPCSDPAWTPGMPDARHPLPLPRSQS